jgi:hypothetical protein
MAYCVIDRIKVVFTSIKVVLQKTPVYNLGMIVNISIKQILNNGVSG